MQSAAMEQVLAKMRSGESTAIAIDDFGTGYSSLARLEELPVDSLKIDRSFIRRSEDDRGVSMLKSIIDLAHRLDMTACAEGVEDRATWDLLITLGCDWVQGYELGYPMPAEQVGPWLERNWGENGPPAAVPTSTNTT
jgi:EAL domain-containing protein (putative c-di-GMP-specific phosphodiesterase class I)